MGSARPLKGAAREELLDVASVVFHVINPVVVFLQRLLTCMVQILLPGRKEAVSPSQLTGSVAEFDTWNFVSASLFVRCRNTTTAGGNGGSGAHSMILDARPKCPSLACALQSPPPGAGAGVGQAGGAVPPTPFWQTCSLLVAPPAGRTGQLLRAADTHQTARGTAAWESRGWGHQAAPQPHLGFAHKVWPCSPVEQEAPNQPLPCGQGAMRTSAAARCFPGIPRPRLLCSVKAPTSRVSTPARRPPTRRCLAHVWPARPFRAGASWCFHIPCLYEPQI